MELKWILVIVFEAAFWLMLATFLVLRYRYEVEGITRLFVIGVVIDTAGILALGVWDFADTGHVSTYTIFDRRAARLRADQRQAPLREARRLDGGAHQAARHQPAVPGPPLNGPPMSAVTQPP